MICGEILILYFFNSMDSDTKNAIRKVMNKVDDTAENAGKEISKNYHKAKEVIGETITTAKDKVQENVSEEMRKAQKLIEDFSEQATGYIKKNPKKAAGIAAGVAALGGLILGSMMASKKKK